MQQYTEATVYPKVEEFLKERSSDQLADYFDCNAFKIQLQYIYKDHQKAGTLSPEKEAEITKLANKLDILQKKIGEELK